MAQQPILIVDRDPATREAFARSLSPLGFKVHASPTIKHAQEKIDQDFSIAALLLEATLPRNLESLLRDIRDLRDDLVIVLMGRPDEPVKNQFAQSNGCLGYYKKNVDPSELAAELRRAISEATTRANNLEAMNTFNRQKTLVGRSPAMKRVRRDCARASRSDKPVLIIGESGTGKELCFFSIHYDSPRKHREPILVNCARLDPSLAESQLFGHLKGSYTDAHADHAGHFAAAEGSTIFLDEVGDTPSVTQPKLLRYLNDGVLARVGESAGRKVDVRVVAATNRDISASSSFRQDLFHRLDAFHIHLPPLRDRLDDIEALVGNWILSTSNRGGGYVEITPDAVARLQTYSWPGNVRELFDLLFRAQQRSVEGVIDADVIAKVLPVAATGVKPHVREMAESLVGGTTCKELLDAMAHDVLYAVMLAANGKVARAAELLDVDSSQVYRRLKAMNIDPRDPNFTVLQNPGT